MAPPLLMRNRNYRLLFTAGALTNLGDGLIVLALPWLASLMTRDPVAIAAVAAASRLPWLLFSVPAGVIIDRVDRRKLIARTDLLRAAVVCGILLLAVSEPVPGGEWALAGLAFLLGSAEVMRDNAAQTILPSIVPAGDLEAANGQMWSAEQITGQFIGPPLAGLLIGTAIALPFGLDVVALIIAAGLVWMITLSAPLRASSRFWLSLIEGVSWMRRDTSLLRLAIVLGLVNFLDMMAVTVTVLFSQEILGLSAVEHGLLLSVAAVGAVAGSLSAPAVARGIGAQSSLYLALAIWGVGYAVIGLSSNTLVVSAAMFALMAGSMLWNVITVSWRQRRVPNELLGRVNSIYRCFGWGAMPLGAMAGGLVVAFLEADAGREAALRMPFLVAAAGSGALLIYALFRLRLR
jgi:MFS family permease